MWNLSVLIAAGALTVAGCGGPETSPGAAATGSPSPVTVAPSTSPSVTPSVAPSTPPAGTSSARPRTGRVVTTGASPYGRVPFDRSGQAIYTFDLESTSAPEC